MGETNRSETIWLVASDSAKVRLGQEILSADGHATETMDAATAKARLKDENPRVLVQFAPLAGPRTLADPADFIVDPGHLWLPDRPVWIIVTPPYPIGDTDGAIVGMPVQWEVALTEPVDPETLRGWVSQSMTRR